MLHYLDDMDAKINGIQEFMKKQVPEGSRWSAYHRTFEQYFYMPGFWGETQAAENIGENESEEE